MLREHILHVFLFPSGGGGGGGLMVFKTSFNNISVISWRLVLLVAFIHRMRYLIITHLSRTSKKPNMGVVPF